jgi:stage II sporulation protein E
MSWARVMGSGAPFGMAMVACSGPGISGVFALCGASAGYLLSGGLDWGIRYVAASVLVYTVAFVFHEMDMYKSVYFMPAASALVMGLTGFLGSFSLSGASMPLAAELFLEITLAFGCTYFFREALSNELCTSETAELCHSVSVMIMAACALMSFSGLVLFRLLSLGRVLALILVMCSAMKGGLLTGAAVGTVLGLAMDVAAGSTAFYAMVYSLSGLLAGVFGKHGRVMFVISFLVSSSLALVCGWDSGLYMSAGLESFCAAVIFMMLAIFLKLCQISYCIAISRK